MWLIEARGHPDDRLVRGKGGQRRQQFTTVLGGNDATLVSGQSLPERQWHCVAVVDPKNVDCCRHLPLLDFCGSRRKIERTQRSNRARRLGLRRNDAGPKRECRGVERTQPVFDGTSVRKIRRDFPGEADGEQM